MKKSVLIFVIFIILLLVALIVVKCVQDGVAEPDPYQSRQPVVSSGEKTSVTVYYLSADQLYLLPLTMDIPATTAPAQVAMERLLAGPPVAGAVDLFPNDTKLINLFSIGDTVYLDLTADFLLMTDAEILNAALAISATVMPLTDCGDFVILVEGENLPEDLQLNGLSLSGAIPYLPVVNLSESSRRLLSGHDFSLEGLTLLRYYLPEASGQYLLPLTTLLEDATEYSAAEMAQLAVNELLSPPEGGGVYLLPVANLGVPRIEVRDGVAYCDFGESLLTSYGQMIEQLLIQCLVRTITAQEGIEAVQFTVNGEIVGQTASGIDLSRPLTADPSLNPVQVN